MVEVRFYQLSRDPVERVVPLLAAKVLEAGNRLLIVSAEAAQRAALSQALWDRENEFLANGAADQPYSDRQPVLVAAECIAINGAGLVLIADGVWREEAATFERAMLLFGADQTTDARQLGAALGTAGHDLRIFKQADGGAWREGR